LLLTLLSLVGSGSVVLLVEPVIEVGAVVVGVTPVVVVVVVAVVSEVAVPVVSPGVRSVQALRHALSRTVARMPAVGTAALLRCSAPQNGQHASGARK
jgi:hypothetical protein